MYHQPYDTETTTGRPRRPGTAMAATSALVLGVLSLGACGGEDAAPDVSPEGQVRYACALATNVVEEHGEPASWEALIGPDANPGMSEAAAASSLLGGMAVYELPDHPQLSEAATGLVRSIAQIDLDTLSSSLDDIIAGCEDVDDGPDPDVSQEGQIEYSCALAAYVIDEHGSIETWGGLGDEPAWHQTASVGALLGGMNAMVIDGEEDLSEAGEAAVTSFSRMDTDSMQESLETIAAGCDSD